jgi:hypothetical protein
VRSEGFERTGQNQTNRNIYTRERMGDRRYKSTQKNIDLNNTPRNETKNNDKVEATGSGEQQPTEGEENRPKSQVSHTAPPVRFTNLPGTTTKKKKKKKIRMEQ